MAKRPRDRVAKVLAAYKAGENVTAIAERLGITPQAVCAAARYHGLLKRNAEKLPPSVVEQVIEAVNAGRSREEIMASFGLTYNNIRWIIDSHRLANTIYKKIPLAAFGEPGRKTVKDLRGRQFGHLKVVGLSRLDGKTTWWVCQCSCGKTAIRSGAALVHNSTDDTSCSKGESMRRSWQRRKAAQVSAAP